MRDPVGKDSGADRPPVDDGALPATAGATEGATDCPGGAAEGAGAAPRPTVPRCPKCGAPRDNPVSCGRCGLHYRRWRGDETYLDDIPDAEVARWLREQWRALVFDEAHRDAHDQLIAAAQAAGLLAPLGGLYRSRAIAHPGEEAFIAPVLQRIGLLAMQTVLQPRGERKKGMTWPRALLYLGMMLAISAGFLLVARLFLSMR